MVRKLVMLFFLATVLSACGASGDTTVPDPPKSAVYAPGANAKIDGVIAGWQTGAWGEMTKDGVKAESKLEKVYTSTASLDELNAFYNSLVDKGWMRVSAMPGVKAPYLLSGYDHGTTSLVVGAIDATQFGGTGTVIYTLKGVK